MPLMLLAACHGHTLCDSGEQGDTLQLRHARHLVIVDYADRTEVTLRNPWDTAQTIARYCLFNRNVQQPTTQSVAIPVPLRCVGMFSTVYCAMLHEMEADEAIGGMCDLQFCHLDYINDGVSKGRIANLGNSMEPNIEQVMNLMPEALMPSLFENNGGLKRVEALGIPIIWCADYMETTPLARAEWIRFFGRLFGKGEMADSIFRTVEHRYQTLCTAAHEATRHSAKPRLLPEMPWRGQWTLPGASSTSAKLYADAGADYIFRHLKGTGSIPLSTEHVVEKGVTADIWLIKYHGTLSRAQMVADTPLLGTIKAPIWWCNTAQSPLYEDTPFHPERLLECLTAILHPELGITPEYNYFQLLP